MAATTDRRVIRSTGMNVQQAGHWPSNTPRGWESSAVNGRRWEFFACRGDTPDLLPLCATDLIGVRSPKMSRVEAVLLVADAPITIRRLVQLATLADVAEARSLIDQLNVAYDHDGTAFRIERVASGYRLLTRPQFAFWLGKVHHRQAELKLSPPALETLAIVAYRQPATRAEIESIRRVQCAEMLKQLMDRGLVRICGEENSLGRPFLYGTTRLFLESFGLRDLDDLPSADSLRKKSADPIELSDADDAAADASDPAA